MQIIELRSKEITRQHKKRRAELIKSLEKYCHHPKCRDYRYCPNNHPKCRERLGLDTSIAWSTKTFLSRATVFYFNSDQYASIRCLRVIVGQAPHNKQYSKLLSLLWEVE